MTAMTAQQAIFRGLIAGWRFLLRDSSADHLFDRSTRGVWLSFAGPLLAFPLYVLYFALFPHPPWFEVGWFHYLLVFMLSYSISRLIWPVVITIIAPLHGKVPEMPAYVAAYNWSVSYQMIIVLIAGLVVFLLGVEPAAGAMIMFCSYGVILLYHMFIVNSVWDIRGRKAFMISLSEFFTVKFALGMTLMRLG